jgi:hypothetical protein
MRLEVAAAALLLTFGLPAPSQAAIPTYTVEEAVALAQAQNPEIAIAQKRASDTGIDRGALRLSFVRRLDRSVCVLGALMTCGVLHIPILTRGFAPYGLLSCDIPLAAFVFALGSTR